MSLIQNVTRTSRQQRLRAGLIADVLAEFEPVLLGNVLCRADCVLNGELGANDFKTVVFQS